LDKVEQWIRNGIERDERYTADEIICGIRNGEFQLFRYPKGVVVTQITDHNRLLVFLLSGEDMDSWKKQATEDLRAFAQSLDIEIVEAYCRPGLKKVLKDLGWIEEQVVLRLRKTIRGAHEREPIRHEIKHRHDQ
jgi:hypothetical protein